MFVGRTVYQTRQRQEKAELARLEADKRRAVKVVYDAYVRSRDVEAGGKFKTTDGTIYGVNKDGSMVRLTGKKKGSKKERREARRAAERGRAAATARLRSDAGGERAEAAHSAAAAPAEEAST